MKSKPKMRNSIYASGIAALGLGLGVTLISGCPATMPGDGNGDGDGGGGGGTTSRFAGADTCQA